MGIVRCAWCEGHDFYERYHDEEWGVPAKDDSIQFEFLVLESAQAGLSWLTVLRKRANYKAAFANFDPLAVAQFDESDIEALMLNPGIIRNRQKIVAAVNNAVKFLEIQKEFGSFSNYIWGFVNHQPVINHYASLKDIPAFTPLSDAISKDLKKRGFKFVGTTIIYAHLQATGIVMDHIKSCHRYPVLSKVE